LHSAAAMATLTPQQRQEIWERTNNELQGPGGHFEIAESSWLQGFPGQEQRVTMRCFVRAPVNLREFYEQCLLRRPSQEFIVFHDERYTFQQFWESVAALGAALVKDLEVLPGDRVAISMRNSPEWCVSLVAVTAVGGVAVPTNSWWLQDELKYGLSDSESKVLLCDDLIYDRVAAVLPSLGVQAILCRSAKHALPPGVAAFSALVAKHQGAACPQCVRQADEAALIMYTSGTTGNPKGVVQTHRGVCNQLMSMLLDEERGAKFREGLRAAGVAVRLQRAPGCVICPVPLFHVTASHHIFLEGIARGNKLVIMDKWDAGVALKLIERERATSWNGVPTMVRDLMEHPDFEKTDTSSLKSLGGGGAPTPPSQAALVPKKFKGAAPGQGYGMTELNGGIVGIGGELYLSKPTSVGKPGPIVDYAVIDVDSGKRLVGPWQRGELVVRSPLCLGHYWKKEKATNETIIALEGSYGWVRTGDVVELDEDGFIYIKDRAKDIIIRGGENISCAEVEAAFFEAVPSIMECACFGIKDDRLGEVVGLMVHMKAGEKAIAEELVASVSGKLAAFKRPLPQHVYFSPEPLPRGATGKTLKREIRDAVNTDLKQGRVPTLRSKL